MIELKNVTKSFQDIPALEQVTATIEDGMIFGLVGSNGAGKSTLLRLVSGILKPDTGTITIDGAPVFECADTKNNFCFLADTVYFFPNATAGKVEPRISKRFSEIQALCICVDNIDACVVRHSLFHAGESVK